MSNQTTDTTKMEIEPKTDYHLKSILIMKIQEEI